LKVAALRDCLDIELPATILDALEKQIGAPSGNVAPFVARSEGEREPRSTCSKVLKQETINLSEANKTARQIKRS